jgi:hypothetical protein
MKKSTPSASARDNLDRFAPRRDGPAPYSRDTSCPSSGSLIRRRNAWRFPCFGRTALLIRSSSARARSSRGLCPVSGSSSPRYSRASTRLTGRLKPAPTTERAARSSGLRASRWAVNAGRWLSCAISPVFSLPPASFRRTTRPPSSPSGCLACSGCYPADYCSTRRRPPAYRS